MPAAEKTTFTVSVEGLGCKYQLMEEDLRKTFSRYGGVKRIRIDEGGESATVTFQRARDARSAMTDLNGVPLNDLGGTMRIHWLAGGGSVRPHTVPLMWEEETLEVVPEAEKQQDPLRGARVKRPAGGTVFDGVVVNIERGTKSRDLLYLILYQDGDVEHLDAEQVRSYLE